MNRSAKTVPPACDHSRAMEDSASDVRPLKRARLDNDSNGATLEPPSTVPAAQHDLGVSTMADNAGTDDGAKELEVGITAFIDASRKPFQGILKKRYTDFLVNEILPNGHVLHLQQMNAKSSSRGAERPSGQSLPSRGEHNGAREEAPVVAETMVHDSKQNGEETISKDPVETKTEPVTSDVSIFLRPSSQSLADLRRCLTRIVRNWSAISTKRPQIS